MTLPAQRQRQAVVFPAPPDAQIFANHQAFVLIRQLAFMDDEAHVRRAGADRLKNLIEGHHDVIRSSEFDVRVRRFFAAQPELQGQKRAGHGAGHGDFFAGPSPSRKTFCFATSIGP